MPTGKWKRTDISDEKLRNVIAAFKLQNPIKIDKIKQPDGLWTVIATFPYHSPAEETDIWYPFSYDTPEGESEVKPAPALPSYDIELGKLSEKYESNGDPGAIGKDNTGGFSYGKYQIATKTGTMEDYLDYLEQEYPEFAERLNGAGGKDSALKGTVDFQETWRELAKNQAFVDSQHAFIQKTHYEPFVARLKGIGLDVNARSKALKNVAWSVSVQHGPGNNVFKNALSNYDQNDLKDNQKVSDKEIIEAVYAERSKVDVYFRKSSEAVKNSVKKRFERELADAKTMLKAEGLT